MKEKEVNLEMLNHIKSDEIESIMNEWNFNFTQKMKFRHLIQNIGSNEMSSQHQVLDWTQRVSQLETKFQNAMPWHISYQ